MWLDSVFYLASASFASAVVFAIIPSGGVDRRIAGVFGATIVLFGLAAFFGLPGTAAWLWIVAHLSPEWSVFKRSAIAVATGPLIGIAWIIYFSMNPMIARYPVCQGDMSGDTGDYALDAR